ncbi:MULTISPECIES: VOC family protein [Niallia]|jgi:lactoylglutathione lyase|uniref:Glyoxalase/bleomycin resistance/extradiol dioxygenase family protein n=1 Tax=Niallia circulans TaxID=1397 RepID=A0A268FC64_NIACI|nr:VOC family protein [Niallia circulans]AYV67663.1 glyoxalase/bleomycin resistance/extradiol dioxygenase family protein [Niallia circulans]AYV73994.1 glyoxalase/bleomycin resistance/extradiol dioxygenase family protein [Niallia circulans]NRG28030.1 VOC family protein [Niallia circulans]PAD82954.1 glyoxalase/bleomycin resistance/extradiol dioxygenase family protein [Niallia circulans]
MKIEHVAIWVKDLEGMKTFYTTYFEGTANSKYQNIEKKFESYFISFKEGARLELMRKAGIDKSDSDDRVGWAHIAISLGSKEAVNQLTERLQKDGFLLVNGPRLTGDGYYESVIEDPEGNLIELTV